MLVHNTVLELNYPTGSEIYKHFPTLRFLILSGWTKVVQIIKTSFNYGSSGSGQNSVMSVVRDVPE